MPETFEQARDRFLGQSLSRMRELAVHQGDQLSVGDCDAMLLALDAHKVSAEAAVEALLRALGQDTTREGLRETPKRVAKMLAEMCRRQDFSFTTFAAEGMDEMIVQAPIPFASLCEHHMLPFVGTAAVAYIPDGKIVGLSKLARAVQSCSAGLQNQERITRAVADMLEENLKPRGVGVVLSARHMCMEIRGVKSPGTFSTSSCLRGVLREDGKAREEFLRLARVGGA